MLRKEPALAKAVNARVDSIVQEHVVQLRTHVKAVAPLHDADVIDDLPLVIRAMESCFADDSGLDHLYLLGPSHAAARFGQSFSVVEVMVEFVLLRRLMFSSMQEELQRDLTHEETDALQLALDTLVVQTVSSVTSQREARLRLENEATSRFLSAMAHDLRNQLNGVMMTMEVLKVLGGDMSKANAAQEAPHVTAEVRELLEEVERCREMMDGTIYSMNRLLEAEKLRGQHVQPRVREIELRGLLAGITRSFGRASNASPGGRFHLDCDSELVIRTDPDLLSTVLVNLVGNAVKYAGGEITLRVVEQTNALRIEVQDDGPGIPTERLDTLFSAYQRGGRKDANGVGLGLYIAKRAARLINGTLEVSSELGLGSTFSITLPTEVDHRPDIPVV